MASNLISRDALVDKTEILYQHTKSGKIIPWSAVRVCAINNTPTVDAVEVVRCKDCVYCEPIPHTNNSLWCDEWVTRTDCDGFCHKGVMKDAVD